MSDHPLHEVSARLDVAAGIATYALLGELDADNALENLTRLLQVAQRHLKALR